MTTYMTEDGHQVSAGEDAYDYYSMKPGKVGRDMGSGWFEFEHTDGTVTMLNGQRICTVEFARLRKFPGA